MLSYFRSNALLFLLFALPCSAHAADVSEPATASLSELAATACYTRGLPEAALPTADGNVFFLRSGPRDTFKSLYVLSASTGITRKLVSPGDLGNKSLGIPSFQLSLDSEEILIPYYGRVFVLRLSDKKLLAFPQVDLLTPRLSPNGKEIAAVENYDLVTLDIATGHVNKLTRDGTAFSRNGLTNSSDRFDFGRQQALWWSPDSRHIAYVQSDKYAADVPPSMRTGAASRLGIVSALGGPTIWAKYSSQLFPYIVRVIWNQPRAPLSAVLVSGDQHREELITVSAATGSVHTLLSEEDPNWVSTAPDTLHRSADLSPYWLSDGSGFLWLSEEHGDWQIEVRDQQGAFLRCATPPGLHVRSLDDIDEKTGLITFEADPDARQCQVYRTDFKDAACIPLTHSIGIHRAVFSADHSTFIDSFSLDDGEEGTDVFSGETGYHLARISSLAVLPVAPPNVKYFRVGMSRNIDAAVVMPSHYKKGEGCPVLLNVNVTSGISSVTTGVRSYFDAQWYANQGYIVVFIDGRGSPDRGRSYEQGISRDLLTAPITDQTSALTELSRVLPEIDLSRVGIMGIGAAGSVALSGPTQRPYFFSCAVAISPVIDWSDYDSTFAQRYLGSLAVGPSLYSRNSIITYVQNVQRPMLLLESSNSAPGEFDDAVKFSELLFAAGKPIDFVPIENDPASNSNIADQVALHTRILSFLDDHLKH